jgi:hypothetical protein
MCFLSILSLPKDLKLRVSINERRRLPSKIRRYHIMNETDFGVFCKKYRTSEKIVRTKCLSAASFEVLFSNGS